MPKIDFNKGIAFDKTIKVNRKELASLATKSMIGSETTFKMLSEAKVFNVPIEDIDEREVD